MKWMAVWERGFFERDNGGSNEKREIGEECLNKDFARFLVPYMSVRIQA